MPTLSIVKTDFGKFLKWGGIALGIIIVIFIIFKLLFFIKDLILPAPPPPPTVEFGKIPAIYFPDQNKNDFTYSVDTLTGDLPTFPISTRVYRMEEKGPDILAVEHASQKVSNLGFNPRPQQISDFVYKWTNPDPPLQNLVLNIKLDEFNLSSSFLNYEEELSSENFKDKDEAINGAKVFLNSLGLYPEDIDDTKTKVEFAILKDGSVHSSTRVVISNLATVYFFQKPRGKVPVVYPEGSNSSMRLLVGAGSLKSNILDGKFSHQNIMNKSATYPIKTAQEAFDDLKSGKGYIASHSGGNNNVVIKKVYLGLYSEGRIQRYMSPVVVFEGSDNFIAYVPALKDEWIDK